LAGTGADAVTGRHPIAAALTRPTQENP